MTVRDQNLVHQMRCGALGICLCACIAVSAADAPTPPLSTAERWDTGGLDRIMGMLERWGLLVFEWVVQMASLTSRERC